MNKSDDYTPSAPPMPMNMYLKYHGDIQENLYIDYIKTIQNVVYKENNKRKHNSDEITSQHATKYQIIDNPAIDNR